PITTLLVLAPTLDSTTSAMRRSRPVMVMAADRNSAAATSVRAVLPKPLIAVVSPDAVPIRVAGFWILGAVPSRKAISAAMTAALMGYSTASVTHTTTAKPNTASMRWPATGNPVGCGSATIAMRTRKPINSPHFLSGGRVGLTWTAAAIGAAMTLPPMLDFRGGYLVPRGPALIYLKREYRRRNRFGARLSFAFPLPNRGTKQPR